LAAILHPGKLSTQLGLGNRAILVVYDGQSPALDSDDVGLQQQSAEHAVSHPTSLYGKPDWGAI
ncbi:MAG: hypothetical protein JXM73_23245, partial [Anaerolineae bacterium]|nr:hypothetical protein [Anaerolineae bacterium]